MFPNTSPSIYKQNIRAPQHSTKSTITTLRSHHIRHAAKSYLTLTSSKYTNVLFSITSPPAPAGVRCARAHPQHWPISVASRETLRRNQRPIPDSRTSQKSALSATEPKKVACQPPPTYSQHGTSTSHGGAGLSHRNSRFSCQFKPRPTRQASACKVQRSFRHWLNTNSTLWRHTQN